MEKIFSATHEFEVVDRIPYGHVIWNIGRNMIDDYLPLVLTGGYDGCQVIGVKKAIYVKDAQKVLDVVGGYGNNIDEIREAIEYYEKLGDRPECVERMKEAIEIMLTIPGIERL